MLSVARRLLRRAAARHHGRGLLAPRRHIGATAALATAAERLQEVADDSRSILAQEAEDPLPVDVGQSRQLLYMFLRNAMLLSQFLLCLLLVHTFILSLRSYEVGRVG